MLARTDKPGIWFFNSNKETQQAMIMDSVGRIADGVYWLGHPGAPVFLLDGESPVVVDAGFACLGPLYARSIKEILGDRQPQHLILTHAHFDHCGAVSVLKRHFPGISVCCAREGERILQKPKALELIRELNRSAEQMMSEQGVASQEEPEVFEPFQVDRVLEDGDVVPLSQSDGLVVYATPGHTRDSLSFYHPERGILLSGEAAGVPSRTGYIFTESLTDYDQYVNSLARLSRLEPEILCLAHNYVYTGEDAREYLQRSLQQAGVFKDWVLSLMERGNGDTEKVMERVKREEYDPVPGPKQPEPAYRLNLEARIKAVMSSKQH